MLYDSFLCFSIGINHLNGFLHASAKISSRKRTGKYGVMEDALPRDPTGPYLKNLKSRLLGVTCEQLRVISLSQMLVSES